MKNKPTIIATVLSTLKKVDTLTREEMLMIIRVCQNREIEGIPDGYWSTNFTQWTRKDYIVSVGRGVYKLGSKGDEYLKNNVPFKIKELKNIKTNSFKLKFYRKYHNYNKKQFNDLSYSLSTYKNRSERLDRVNTDLLQQNHELRSKIIENTQTNKVNLLGKSDLEERVEKLEKEVFNIIRK